MIMNSVELETLKLCAMGRFMPCSIAGKYDLPELRVSMLNFLVKKGYVFNFCPYEDISFEPR